MRSETEALLSRIRSRLGPRADPMLAEIEDHLLSATEHIETTGTSRARAEASAIERLGDEEELLNLLAADLQEEARMDKPAMRRLTSLTIVLAGGLGASAALASYGSRYAAPVRTAAAAALLTIALVGTRRLLAGRVGSAGVAMAIVCSLAAVASLDRDGIGFGIAGALVGIGVGYSVLAFGLVRRAAIPTALGIGLGLPVLAGGLRIAASLTDGTEGLTSASAVVLGLFGVALAWLAYRIWPEDLVVELRSSA